MKFIQTHTDYNGNLLESVTMEIKEDVHIDDALEAFGRFLKAAGYYFDGSVTIADDDFVRVEDMSPAFEGEIEGFDEDSWVDDYIAEQTNKEPANNWPFPTATKP